MFVRGLQPHAHIKESHILVYSLFSPPMKSDQSITYYRVMVRSYTLWQDDQGNLRRETK